MKPPGVATEAVAGAAARPDLLLLAASETYSRRISCTIAECEPGRKLRLLINAAVTVYRGKFLVLLTAVNALADSFQASGFPQ